MPRPQKCRCVCATPRCAGFLPAEEQSGKDAVVLAVDEYEAIRLIDLVGLTQEECAARMEIARTTVTGIYDSARRKLADALVNGRGLVVRGGNYRLCEGAGPGCGGRRCHKGGRRHIGFKGTDGP